jgi:ribonuclease E
MKIILKKKIILSEEKDKKKEIKFKFKRYKIQEVIKPNQVILVQVIKDERGQKGAALSTFISIAGKYIVLMPNTPKGGGISRKIFNPGR